MFEKANRLQDPEQRTTPLVVLFLGRASFCAIKIHFRYLAVRKSVTSGVYWLQLVIMELTMLKHVRNSEPFTGS